LPKCIDYTGVKGSQQANQKTNFGFNQGAKGQPKAPLVWRTGLSGVPPDSVRCTRGLQLQLATFGNYHRRLHYNSPDSVRCSKGGRPQKLASFGKLQRLVRYNSPDMSGVHRTVRCNSGATAISAPTASCGALNARAARAEVRRAHTGTPDNEQYMSGVHRTSRRAHKSEVPTVRIQRQ
jgi:hypothetical protein